MHFTSKYSSIVIFGKKFSTYLLVLLLALFFRGITLEYGDLIDPTETRYATIAENMLISSDWVTPRLPTENGLEAYLSKPPLHFWLTAIAYKFLGIDEWTSRLPSYLSLLLITLCLIIYSKNFLTKEAGYIAGIVTCTSPLIFVLAGSSTVDLTFGALVFAALVFFAISAKKIELREKNFLASAIFFSFCALAFLTKGPLALILIGMPIAFFCLFKKSFAPISNLHLTTGTILFLGICAPWFYLLEKANPGSVWYYFYNENYLRYVTKDYGGRYGAAHIRPYGSIWIMLILSLLPWSLYLFINLFNRAKNYKQISLKEINPWVFFSLACGLSPVLFFTVGRSILPAYVAPGIPGLALYLGYVLSSAKKKEPQVINKKTTRLKELLHFSPLVGLTMLTILLTVLFFVAPIIETKKSAAELIELIALETRREKPTIAVIATDNYSPFWISSAYKEELSKPVNIKYATPTEIENGIYKNVIIRDKGRDLTPIKSNPSYKKIASKGYWHWYRRVNIPD